MIEQQTAPVFFPPWVTRGAGFISVLFHPLFIGAMMAAYLLFIHPSYFIGFSDRARLMKLLIVINNNVFFPLVVVGLLRGLGFNKSFLLKTQKERIVPYIASITFFFWSYYVFKNQTGTPEVMVGMCRGMFLSAAASLLLNNYFKISMHAVGIGGLLGLVTVSILDGSQYAGIPVLVALFLSGITITSRKIVSDHSWFDLISGLLVGFLFQLISLWI
ncbi:MAG: hypothetical protein ACK5F9_05515 [Bacteroidota bacterium]|jgi:hypothetical protein|nr:hypothetical protein [Chitinophagaceae bacterium]MCE2758525.1 hypothetical protein [Chitinophagaceae bacterium]